MQPAMRAGALIEWSYFFASSAGERGVAGVPQLIFSFDDAATGQLGPLPADPVIALLGRHVRASARL